MGKRAMGLGALAGVPAAAIGTLLLAPSGDSALASQRDSVPPPPPPPPRLVMLYVPCTVNKSYLSPFKRIGISTALVWCRRSSESGTGGDDDRRFTQT